jgi:glycine/D-amino acid oxidase-like deaminating enzyme
MQAPGPAWMMPTITPHRDLHGGLSPWQDQTVRLPARKRLRRNRDCDVLIVGAGISGALLADSLSAVGLHVILCDRREPLHGSTAASTAMLMHEIDTPLSHLAAQIGRRDAERMWRRSFIAVHALRDRTRALGIEADLQECSSLYLQGNVLDAGGLHREAEARARAGFEVEFLSAPRVRGDYGIARRAALRSSGTLTASPRALAAGFLRAAATRDAELLAPEEVLEVVSRRRGVRATLRSGHHIDCRHLVFATGYELPRQVPPGGHRINSTWAIATVPQKRIPWRGPDLIWEASSPYLYLRSTADGRVLCGGGDEPYEDTAKRDAALPRKRDWLRSRLRSLVPRVDARVDYAWSGSFGGSAHGLPTIGEIPRLRNCYAVMGYGGNGITFSMMAAQMLRNVLQGDDDPDLDLVAFRRRR